jgi:hypothetical protein
MSLLNLINACLFSPVIQWQGSRHLGGGDSIPLSLGMYIKYLLSGGVTICYTCDVEACSFIRVTNASKTCARASETFIDVQF